MENKLYRNRKLVDPTSLRKQGISAKSDSKVIEQYIRNPQFFRLQPSPYFISKWYSYYYNLDANIHPWIHYCVYGEKNGFNPNYLFHTNWYKEYYNLNDDESPLLNFVTNNDVIRYPSPYFEPNYYINRYVDVFRSGMEPFSHYLDNGSKENRNPHPFFDAEYFAQIYPCHQKHPLSHFLQNIGNGEPVAFPHPLGADVLTEDSEKNIETLFSSIFWNKSHAPGSDAAKKFLAAFSDKSTYENIPHNRVFADFDHSREAKICAKLKSQCIFTEDNQPLISVIIPTRNRDAKLTKAVQSVLNQTFRKIEVIVINDGGSDSTKSVIDNFNDNRLRYYYQEWNGVSAARNTGLKNATGKYISFLDSDNEMVEYFLDTMVRFCRVNNVRFAYSGLRMFNEDNSVRYRGEAYNPQKLQSSNYIDMNIILHEREYFSDIFFDETLRRCVDWEYILHLCQKYSPAYVPIIGCNYWHEAGEQDRITVRESVNDAFRVFERYHEVREEDSGRSLTVILALCHQPTAKEIQRINSFIYKSGDDDINFLLCANNCVPHSTVAAFNSVLKTFNFSPVFQLQLPASTFVLFNQGLLKFRNDKSKVALIATLEELDKNRILSFFNELTDNAIVDVHGDNHVASALYKNNQSDKISIGYILSQDLCGSGPKPFLPLKAGIYLSADVKKQTLFDMNLGTELAIAEQCYRWQINNVSLNYVYSEFSSGASADSNNRFLIDSSSKEIWSELSKVNTKNFLSELRTAEYGIGNAVDLTINNELKQVYNISIMQNDTVDIGIMCPAPNEHSIAWGDLHYCKSLLKGFEKDNKVTAKLITRDEWDKNDSSCDQYLHVCGVLRPQLNIFRPNHLWCISHPDKFSMAELDSFSTISVASEKLAMDWSRLANKKVHTVLQCSEFDYKNVKKLSEIEDKLIFIGNTKSTYRSAIRYALNENVPLYIIGEGWDKQVSRDFVLSTYLDNTMLQHIYGSALAVMNEHWDTMKENGILSNRLFDVVCSGGRVLSDECVGFDNLFTDFGYTFRDKNTLYDSYRKIKDTSPSRRQYDEFIAKHSFEDRAHRLIQIIYGD